MKRRLQSHNFLVMFLLVVLTAGLLSAGCRRGSTSFVGEVATATRPQTTPPAAAPTLTADPLPTVTATPSATVPPTETAGPPTPTPTTTPVPTPVLPEPWPGWAWYYTDFLRYAVPYPETWETGPFRAPGSNSQLRMGADPLPEGVDWLDWVRSNQEDLIYTVPVLPEHVEVNAIVHGRPAYFRVAEGGGSSTMLLAFPDGDRVVHFYFHSGVLPRSVAEMEIFRTMIENIVWADGSTGETALPEGWERGRVLTQFANVAYPAGPAPPLRELSGTMEKWDTPVGDRILLADDGQRYTLNAYHLARHFDTESLEEGERVLIADYNLLTDPATIQPETIAVERGGTWELAYYRSLFDLTRETLDPALLSRYPQGIRLALRGPWSEIQPFLLTEAEQPFPAGTWEIEPSTPVQAHGRAVDPGGSMRLILDRLLVSNNAGCVSHVGGGEACFFWQLVYPPAGPITITATISAVAPEANVLVLEQPVDGFITITLAEGGQLLAEDGSTLTWADLTAGMQVTATGEPGEAGTLLVTQVQVIAAGPN